LQNDLPPASGTPQVVNDGPEEFDNSYRWHNDFRVVEGAPSSSEFDSDAPMPVGSEAPPSMEPEAPPPLELEAAPAAPPAPEAHTFFNEALKQKLTTFSEFSAVAGASVIITLEIQNLIKAHSHGSHGAYVSAYFLPLLPTSNRVTNILTYDLPQSTRWQGSCK
jgi:hypothetical protein